MKSMIKRMIIPALLIILIIGSIIVSFFSRSFTRIARREVLFSLQQTLDQAGLNLNDRMEAIATVSSLLTHDMRLQNAINRGDQSLSLAEQLKDIRWLREMLEPALLRKDILNIRIYLPSTHILSKEGVNFFSMDQGILLPEYPPAVSARGSGTWVDLHQMTQKQKTAPVISFVRSIKSTEKYEKIDALICVDAIAQPFQEIMQSLTRINNQDNALILMDDEHKPVLIVGANELKDAYLNAEDRTNNNKANTSHTYIENHSILRTSLERSDWSLIAILPNSGLLRENVMISRVIPLTIAVVLLIMVIVIFFIIFLANTTFVHRTVKQMNLELSQSGILPPQFRKTKQQDIYRLRDGVNNLIDTATGLVEEAYEARMNERKAALRALQAQINPHFLYNTLDTIYWQTMRQNALDAASTIKNLADYFRISLSSGRDRITLEEELKMVDSYLKIQLERYDHGFTVAYHVDKDACQILIPKFTIQPIVENSLLHGIQKRRDSINGKLIICVKKYEDGLQIKVLDNGPGFAHEESIDEEDEYFKISNPNMGFGLRNVKERLHYYTKGKYKMAFERVDDMTQVSVSILSSTENT